MFKIISLLILAGFVMFFAGCGDPQVIVAIQSQAFNQIKAYRSIDMGGTLIVDEYNVTFYKIEVGNSELDKFTLWENPAGETVNLVDAFSFQDVLPADAKTYQFCRLTIEETISLTGSYSSVPGSASVVVAGNAGLDTGTLAVFVFGTAEAGVTGNFLLTNDITVGDGTVLTAQFNIGGTVTYSSGIQLAAPSLEFVVE